MRILVSKITFFEELKWYLAIHHSKITYFLVEVVSRH